jgi:hypothetical protein
MIIKFDKYLNESLGVYKDISNSELAKELEGAKYIQVELVKDKYWGVKYLKNKEIFYAGKFLMNDDVHEFLLNNNIDYGGKEGYMVMKKYRDNMIKIPFDAYQRDLIKKGIEDI